jgi:putative phosphoesterase
LKVGLISDTHIPESRRELWPQIFDAFSDVDCILHAGDLHELSVIDILHEIAPTYAARGNGEDGSGGRAIQPDHDQLQEAWMLELNGFKIGLTHYIPMPQIPPRLTVSNWAKKLYPDHQLDVLIYGDTHVEQVDLIDGILCINPGSPTYPHNLNLQLGTIGFLDLSGDKPEAEIFQIVEDGITPFDWAASRRPW